MGAQAGVLDVTEYAQPVAGLGRGPPLQLPVPQDTNGRGQQDPIGAWRLPCSWAQP